MLQNLQVSRTRSVFVFIAFAMLLLIGKANAQTDPLAQSLPFTPTFSTLNGTVTTYPAGFQGWSVTGSLTTTVLTAPPSGDQGFIASQDNSITVPFVGDMVGKIGILSGASNVKTLCLALNTSGVSTVQLIYTAATQGQTAGGYIDELDLQYRVPPATNFTTIPGATYQNDALSSTNTATTTAYNPSTVYVTLPGACGNQAVVELRWIQRNVSGMGTTHPGFSVTNITAQAQATADYYCKPGGNLDAVATWGPNTDGSGTSPVDFMTGAQVFHITNGNTGALSGVWTVSGAASKIIVDGTDFTIGTNSVVATIDVNAGRTLTISNLGLPTFGVLNSASTVKFLGLTGVVVPVTGIVYPNLVFDNTSVTIPGTSQKISFSGNFTVQNMASFAMANTTAGYSLLTSGNNNQVITANGIPTTIWTLDVGGTNAKTAGTVTIGTNTTLSMDNSITMILTGPAAQFIDGGNTLNTLNNLDLSGNAAGYNFTGTLNINAAGSGSCNIRGGSATTNPCVGAVNNLGINNSINIKVNPTAGGQTLTVKGNLTIASTAGAGGSVFNFQGNTIAVGGNVAYNNTTDIFTNTGTLLFNGTTAQTYTTSVTGGNTISKVAINNSAGLTINSPLNVTNNLTLTNGVITTGSNAINIGAAGTVTVTGTSSYVKGNLSKAMPVAGTTSMSFEVGDATYAPVKLTFGGSVNSGSIAVKSTAGLHPFIGTSFINTGKFVNRYWSVTNNGVAPSPATINVALSYNTGDLTGGTDNTGYIIRKYASSAWTTAPAETNSTTATAPLQPLTSITTGVASASVTADYVAGAPDCSVTAGTVTATPAFLCGSGTSTLALTGATTNTGNSYQWQSSADGATWTGITGATTATYTTPSISASTYYICTVGCIPTGTTLNAIPAVVTVNAAISAISGANNVCQNGSTTLSDVDGSGTWVSGNTSAATVIGSTGAVTGVAGGTTVITFTLPDGCATTTIFTVNPLPAPGIITGLATTYVGANTTLSDAATSGTWTSANTAIGTVGSSSGVVTGIASGSVIVSYTLNNTCGNTTVTANVTVSLPFTQGNLVVEQPFNSLNGNSKGINLLQYTTSGVLVSSNPLPYSGSSRITMSGNAASEGFASLSLERDRLIVYGYDYDTGTASISASLITTVNRAVGSVIPSGAFTRQYSQGVFSGVSMRGATAYGNNFYAAGANTGVELMNTPSNISNTFTNCRNLQIYNGNLYVSASTGVFKGVSQVGTGIPTASGQTEVLLATDASANGPYGFSVSPDGNTMYVGSSSTGIMKFTRTGASGPFAVAAYTVYTVACSGIAVDYSTTNPTIYATTSAGTSLIKIQDAGSTTASLATYTVLATTPSSNAFRGVMFAPASYASVLGSTAICAGNSANIIFNGNPHGTVTYNINGGSNQTIVLDSAKALATIGTGTLTAGNYTYSLVSITTPAGTATVSGSVTVTVNPLPSTITGNTNICVTASTALSDVDAGGTWSNTNTNASVIGSTGVVTGQGAGLDTIIYTLPTSCAANIVVTISAAPSITSANNDGPLCAGATLNLSVTGASNVAGYAWSGPVAITSATSASASVPFATAAANGIYTVTVNNGAGIGCTALYTTTAITVNPVPSSGGAGNSSPICNGGTVTLSDNSSNATAWSWTGSDGYVSSLQSPIATPTITTTYSLTVSSTGNGCNPSSVYTTIATVNTVPSSTGATNNSPVCSGGNVTLGDNSSNATAWSWVGSDGFVSSLQSPVATPTTTTTTYSLTISSIGNGCNPSTVFTTIVTVNPAPFSSGATNNGPICNGGTVTLNDHSINATGWTWTGSDGSASTLQSPAVTPTITTTYSLTLSGTGGGCNTAAVYTTIVTVNTVPSSTGATNDGPICNGGTVNLGAHSSNATAWSWIGSDGFTSSLQNPTATPTANVTYSLTVSSTGSGCNPSTIHTTIVTVNAVPSSTGATNDGPICNGGTVNLSAHSINATAWSWVGSDGFTSSLQNPAATPTVNVTYSLTVSSTGSGCNPSTIHTTVVTVNAVPSSTGATNDGPICNGGTVNLSAHSSNATAWSWVGSDGFTSSLQNPTATPTVNVTYSLTVSSTGSGCSPAAIHTTIVTVNAVPLSTGATNDGPICNGGTVNLSAHSTNATAWSWVGSDGFTSSLQNPTATPTVNVTYSLTVSSTGSGCNPSTIHTTIVTVNVVPSSTGATNDGPICSGGTVTLSAHSSNATAWSWVGSDGFTSSLQNPTATPTVNVTYSLTVSSTGSGCNPSIIHTTVVTVNAVPSSTGVTNSSPICNGGTVTLSDNSNNATTWSWVGSDGSTSSLQSPGFTPTITTTYSLTMTGTGNGCNSLVYTTIVTVNAVPSSTGATNNGPICNGGTVTLSAHSSNATAWSWIGSDGFTSSLQNPTATPTVNVTYSLTVSSTGNGCNPAAIHTTQVTVNAVPSSTGATNDGPICAGGTVNFGAHSSNATAWSWTGPGGFSSSLQNPSATPSLSGSYLLTVSSTGNGCSPSTIYSTIVTIQGVPSSGGVTNSSPICNGGNVTLSAHSSNATAWSWIGSDGFTSSLQNPTATPTVNATYSLTVSSTGNGCNPLTVYTTAVTVNALPSSSGAGNDGPICNGGTVNLSAHSSNATAWLWVGSDGFTSSLQNPAATPTVNATYSLTVSSAGNGCNPPSTYTTIVTVNTVPSSTGVTNNSPVCNGNNVTLTAHSSNASAWSWIGSDGFTSSLQNPTATPTVNVTYSLTVSSSGSGCNPSTVYATIVTVNPLPDAINGSGTVSVGFGTTLSDDITPGSWSSDNGNVTVGTSSGSISGVNAGTSVITYMLATGCSITTIMTINAVPPVITGTMTVCAQSGITLTDAATGGTWTSNNGNVTIGSSSGTVAGVSVGTSVITYTFPTTGYVTAIVTINPLPTAILGTATVCNGLTTTLSNATGGVAWSGSNANATVGGLSGIVTGTNAGTATITCYILATGCSVSTTVTVNALPAAILGSSQVCSGLQATLSDAGAGTWSSNNGNATIGSGSGTVTGSVAGTSVITYTLPVTGCINTTIVTVNPLPNDISGAGHVCAGLVTTLSDAGAGSWSGNNSNATVSSVSGTVTGNVAGTSVITYTLLTGCIKTTIVTVDPIVAPAVSILPGTTDTVCSGTTVLFTATPVNGGITPVYQWKVNTTVTAATSNTYSYEPANGDIVHVLLTSSAACATPATVAAADTMTVILTDTTAIHVSVTPNDTVCLGSSVVFTAVGANGGTSPVYNWMVNGTAMATGLVYGYVPANNDNVYCTMVSSLRCKTTDTAESNHIVMTVDTAYIPTVEVVVTPGTSIQLGEADTFRALVSNGGPIVTYQWILNTTVLAGATNEMYYASGFGNNDSMTCVVTSAGPCGYASFNTVKIHVIATGVTQYATGMDDVRLIPNPNKGQFTVKGSLGTGVDEEVTMEITDMLGQVVYRNKLMMQNGAINEAISLNNTLANGMYMLNLHTGNERKVIHFVIEQ